METKIQGQLALEGRQKFQVLSQSSKCKKETNTIHSLRDNGVALYGERKPTQSGRFTLPKVFGTKGEHPITLDGGIWTLYNGVHEIEKPFKEREVKEAIWNLAPEKAPGSDGFPIIFFKNLGI